MLKVAFDVDSTLIKMNEQGENVPRHEVIDLFRKFESFGCAMHIWSGSGVDYAARWRDKLGLSAVVVAKGSFLPDLAVDDMDVELGKVNLKV